MLLKGRAMYSVQQIQRVIDHYTKGICPVKAEDFVRVSEKTGVAIDLMLAQGIQESRLGTLGRGARTHNIYNVGNVDSGANREMNDWVNGMLVYGRLMAQFYGKTAEEVLARGFRRTDNGCRYATDPNYVNAIRRLVTAVRKRLAE